MKLDVTSAEHQRRLLEADEQDAMDLPDGGDYGDTQMAGIWLLVAVLVIVVIASLSVLL